MLEPWDIIRVRDFLASHPIQRAADGELVGTYGMDALRWVLASGDDDNPRWWGDVPSSVSPVLSTFVDAIAEELPVEFHNAHAWHEILISVAGSSSAADGLRVAEILNWAWTDMLGYFEPVAVESGFGGIWRRAMDEQSSASARSAALAARRRRLTALDKASTFLVGATRASSSNEEIVFCCGSSAMWASKYLRMGVNDDAADEAWESWNPLGLMLRLISF
jgi:hypothetical protein